jgi:hypothetical protein
MSLFSGWGDLWDVATGSEQRRGEAADARLEELNRAKRERGEWTDSQYNEAERNRIEGSTGSTRGEVLGAAAQGAAEGLAALPGQVRETLTAGAGWTLALVPWWGWILALGAVAYYLGAFTRARNILAK